MVAPVEYSFGRPQNGIPRGKDEWMNRMIPAGLDGKNKRDGGHPYGSFLPDSFYMRIFYNFSILCQKR